jgi:hypothetical protein
MEMTSRIEVDVQEAESDISSEIFSVREIDAGSTIQNFWTEAARFGAMSVIDRTKIDPVIMISLNKQDDWSFMISSGAGGIYFSGDLEEILSDGVLGDERLTLIQYAKMLRRVADRICKDI